MPKKSQKRNRRCIQSPAKDLEGKREARKRVLERKAAAGKAKRRRVSTKYEDEGPSFTARSPTTTLCSVVLRNQPNTFLDFSSYLRRQFWQFRILESMRVGEERGTVNFFEKKMVSFLVSPFSCLYFTDCFKVAFAHLYFSPQNVTLLILRRVFPSKCYT
jgi:hypothetical protein